VGRGGRQEVETVSGTISDTDTVFDHRRKSVRLEAIVEKLCRKAGAREAAILTYN
jgi:hypothetical protein